MITNNLKERGDEKQDLKNKDKSFLISIGVHREALIQHKDLITDYGILIVKKNIMNYQTNYAYKTLTDELRNLREALKIGDWSKWPQAVKRMKKKCSDLNNVLKMLDDNGAPHNPD